MRRLGLAIAFFTFAFGTFLLWRAVAPLSPDAALAAGLGQLLHAENISGVVSVVTSADAAAKTPPMTVRGVGRVAIPKDGAVRGDARLATVEADGNAGLAADVRVFAGKAAYLQVAVPSADGAASSVPKGLPEGWLRFSADVKTDAAAASDALRSLRDAAFDGALFTTDGTVTREKLGTTMAYHHMLGVTPDGAAAFAKLFTDALRGIPLIAAPRGTEEAPAAARVELWTDQKTGRVLQMQIRIAASATGPARIVLIEAVDTTTAVAVEEPETSTPATAALRAALAPSVAVPAAAGATEKRK